jgi:hypothetical protein
MTVTRTRCNLVETPAETFKPLRLKPNTSPRNRLLIPGCGVVLLALFGLLYATDTAQYLRIVGWITGKPGAHPFIDWEWLPSAVACWQRGVDVYVDNICYGPVAHGRHGYSPLWLRMTFLPYGKVWLAPFGLGMAVLFLAALATLPPPRRAGGVWVTFLATFSSVTVFAIERGNVDLMLFVLVAAGVHCWLGSLRWRLVGYGLFILAGLLKFYPFVLLILALRERPRVLAGVCAATLAVLAAFGLAFRDELSRMSGNVASGPYFGDMFAAINLPDGLVAIVVQVAREIGEPDAWVIRHQTLMSTTGLLTVTLAAILGATGLMRRYRLDTALAAMPRREAGFLVAGAALICACFFAGQNVGYRAILLLPVLPGLLWFGRSLPDRGGRILVMATCGAIVFVMQVLAIRQLIAPLGPGSVTFFVHWLLHELAWWWVVTVLAAVLAGFISRISIAWVLQRNGQLPAPDDYRVFSR